jgi:serine/threonine protein kinase
MKEIIKGDKIGEGGYASVYFGKWMGSIDVALKQLHSGKLSESTKRSFDSEVNIMKRLQHPNIIRLYGICKPEGENQMMVMEFMEKGSLYQHLHEDKIKFSTEKQKEMMIGIANGLYYLHLSNPKIIHRDLKSMK